MEIVSYAISDTGMVRTRNEDSYYRSDELNLYVVADGMGGHRGGDVASRLAVEEIERAVREWSPEDENEITHTDGARPPAESKLLVALKRANAKIWQESTSNPERRGMGTTATSVLMENSEATIAHVGDSRAYLIRENVIKQITEDHSWVNEQVKAGFITSEEAKTHRLKNLITRSLGHEADVKVDVVRLKAEQSDLFLLCSDGLTNLVEDEEMQNLLIGLDPDSALKRMVELANERGGHDNITAVMIKVQPG